MIKEIKKHTYLIVIHLTNKNWHCNAISKKKKIVLRNARGGEVKNSEKLCYVIFNRSLMVIYNEIHQHFCTFYYSVMKMDKIVIFGL